MSAVTAPPPCTLPVMRVSQETIDLADIRLVLQQGCRIALLMRHSERPPIRADDKEFGRHLGLTPSGIEMATAAGRQLKGIRDVCFSASPMTRCRLTARHFAEGMGFTHPVVHDDEKLGVRGFYYEDPYAVQDIMRQQGYMAYMQEYLLNGIAPHSCPIGPATDQLACWLQQRTTTQLGVYVTHDIFVAAFLTGLKVRTFTSEDWVGFLHGAAVIQRPDDNMAWSCQPFIPSRADAHSAPSFVH